MSHAITSAETGEPLYEIALMDFHGFYESVHNDHFDDTVSSMADLSGEGEFDQAKADQLADQLHGQVSITSEMVLDYCKEYVSALRDYLKEERDLELPSLKVSQVVSPREYNFGTDRIFVTLDQDDLNKLVALNDKDPGPLRQLAAEELAPRSGFIPFHSADIDDWGDDPTRWDAAKLGLLLKAVTGGWEDQEVLDNHLHWGGVVQKIVDDHLTPEAVATLNALDALVHRRAELGSDSPEP